MLRKVLTTDCGLSTSNLLLRARMSQGGSETMHPHEVHTFAELETRAEQDDTLLTT